MTFVLNNGVVHVFTWFQCFVFLCQRCTCVVLCDMREDYDFEACDVFGVLPGAANKRLKNEEYEMGTMIQNGARVPSGRTEL